LRGHRLEKTDIEGTWVAMAVVAAKATEQSTAVEENFADTRMVGIGLSQGFVESRGIDRSLEQRGVKLRIAKAALKKNS
jgi:hypothetical protein